MRPEHPDPWFAEIKQRMRRHLLLKLAGTTLWTWVFFIGYFHLLRHAVYPVTVMPVTRLETMIPVTPLAIVPYLSLWFYVGIAPGLQRTFRELLAYGAWAGLLCAIGLALFYRWPTRIPTFVFDRGGVPGFALLQGIDAPGNACPSMHVAIGMFTAIWIGVQFRECGVPIGWRVVNWIWFAAIAYSTLAIRQHVLIDVVAGAALGIACAAVSLRLRPGRRDRVVRVSARSRAPAMMAPHDPPGRTEDVGAVEHGGRKSRAVMDAGR
jgi:membrane-associated phospholipid phosphatase